MLLPIQVRGFSRSCFKVKQCTCIKCGLVSLRKIQKTLTVLLLLLFAIQTLTVFPAKAEDETNQPPQTLAETINNILDNVSVTDSVWNTVYGQVFCRQNASVFNTAITKAASSESYADVIFIARLAELNNYTSPTITSCLTDALQNMPMCGSLPITYESPTSFLLYDRYMVNAYRYAQTLNVSGWNIEAAYSDFANTYRGLPQQSVAGEMLYLNPVDKTAVSFSSRYYDEHAETLEMFLQFYLNGVNDSMAYADDAWINTQAHWNGEIYGYTNKDAGVECEMGNFAQIAAMYRNSRGDIPYFDRVVADLEDKLLISGFDSPGWGKVGVVKHSESNVQFRLYETMGSLIALQMIYPDFTEGNRINFQNMLQTAWRGLMDSRLVCNNTFSFMDADYMGTPGSYTQEANFLGAMTLFLYGVVPQNGSLAIDASNEKYQDYLTCFPTQKWQFNYADHSIRIPVYKGNLTFIYGTQNATADFPEDGVYNVQFSSDWNSVTQTTKIADSTRPVLESVTLQTIEKQTTQQTHPIQNPPVNTSQEATPKPTLSPTPTVTPIPTPEIQNTSTPSPKVNVDNSEFPLTLMLAAIISVVAVAVLLVLVVKVVRSGLKKTSG